MDLRIHDKVFLGDQEYEVERVTRGGMGFVVFLVKLPSSPPSNFLGVYRINMVLKSALADFDEKSASDFKRELAIWAGFEHHGIVKLVEILDGADAGWVAMMHRASGTVRELLKKRGYLSIPEATLIIGQMIEALSYAFEKDHVLHLDIKPENVLYHFLGSKMVDASKSITVDQRFMISDWGIASVKSNTLKVLLKSSLSQQEFDQTMNNFGTTRYMAPERFIEGYRSSFASDVFSVGMMYLEMLTGGQPFREAMPETEMLLSGFYLDESKALMTRQGLPMHIQKAILRMIALQPDERPKSHAELSRLITACKPRFLSKLFN
jgi:serine/threonine protein kinase